MKKITLIEGDGIGPEVTKAVRDIIEACGSLLDWEICQAGAASFKKGIATGVPLETIESIKRNKVVLKGPLETPVGYGEKSANVTLRNLFSTYANIRPIKTIPGILTPYSNRHLDFVIVRENLEDLYVGMEYQPTQSSSQALKLITRLGCEKIIRYAFELAQAQGRKSVHCATKANILKLTEGMMKRVFEEVAKDYPDIQAKHLIVDNCAHQLVIHPEQFEVIVTTNLQGDILSDLASGLVGGLGIAPGANIGDDIAIFEAVHGAAPDIAGKNKANPTALLFSTILLLKYIDEIEAAHKIEQALIYTFAHDQFFTSDLDKTSSHSTAAFVERIIKNLGKTTKFTSYKSIKPFQKIIAKGEDHPDNRQLIGVDIFLEKRASPKDLGHQLEVLVKDLPFKLSVLSNRGLQVYPLWQGGHLDLVDTWCCRFTAPPSCGDADIISLLSLLSQHYTWYHVEKLYAYGHRSGYSKLQGEN